MEMKKMMKRAGLGLMLAAAMAGLAGCGGNGSKERASKPAEGAKVAKEGFLNGVSGGVASHGLAEKEGFDLAGEEVNKEGKIQFHVEIADYNRNELMVMLGAAAIILCTSLIGLVSSCLIYILLWLKLVEHAPWKAIITIEIIMAAIILGVFTTWLQIRFPVGLLGSLLGL